MFNWFKSRRRKKVLAAPWPEAWSQHLNRNVRLSRDLNDVEVSRLKEIVKIMVAEKNWEGLEGLSVTEEMKVTIAGQAAMLLLGVNDFYFDNVESIPIFPTAFLRKTTDGVQLSIAATKVFDEVPKNPLRQIYLTSQQLCD